MFLCLLSVLAPVMAVLPVKAADVGQGDSRTKLPKRKAGLWEVTVQAHAPRGMSGVKQGPVTVQQCTDAKTERVMLLAVLPTQENCVASQVAKRAGKAGSGYDIAVACKVHDQPVLARMRLTGDLQSVYAGTYRVEYPGKETLNVGPVDFQGRWLGGCKPGQRPGDLRLPNGITVNPVDDAARAEQHRH